MTGVLILTSLVAVFLGCRRHNDCGDFLNTCIEMASLTLCIPLIYYNHEAERSIMKKAATFKVRSAADVLGLSGSAACAIHCLLIPLLLISSTTLPVSFFTDESFHRAMLWIAIPAAILAFSLGCWRHRDRLVFILGLLGVAGLFLSAFVAHDLLGETGERVGTIASAAALVTAHVRNWRLCRTGACET